MCGLATVFIAAATFLQPSFAQADAQSEAIEHFRRAQAHYEASRYRQAVQELHQALMLDPKSSTLNYNLGRVHERLGEPDLAVEYYSRALQVISPDNIEQIKQIEEAIARLQQPSATLPAQVPIQAPEPQVAPRVPVTAASGPQPAQDAPLSQPTAPRAGSARFEASGEADRLVPVQSDTEDPSLRTAVWVALGTGAALAVAGAAAGMVALSRRNDLDGFVVGRDGSLEDHASKKQSIDNLALGADVLLVGGAVGLVTAGVLYAIDQQRLRERRLPTGPSVATDGRSVLLQVRGDL